MSDLLGEIDALTQTIITLHAKCHNQGVCSVVLTKRMEDMVQGMINLSGRKSTAK